MPYYGHNLVFGTRLSAPATSPLRAVKLAQLSERLGYDLVIIEDQASGPENLDAWTILCWIAGVTERIWLGGLVQRLGKRLPGVVARSVASLDLLSGGRAELAFGPADDLNEIEALDEAIDILRAIWDAGEPGPLMLDGAHYRIPSATRGPLPEHTIPIWLSGTSLPMLELTGRTADGWIGSPDQLPFTNAVIDASAVASGRDPTEISRIVTVQGNEDLASLVLDSGAGIILLVSDDPEVIEAFARDTIPALRAEVERARSGLPEIVPLKPTRIRAKRRPGIAYDAVPASLSKDAVEPGDTAYSRLRSNYMRGGSPGIILRPGTTAEVADAVAFAREHRELPLSVRSRGHGISGRSTNDGGLIIDLRRLSSIEILDEATRRIRVGPGARWMDVAAALDPYGWALSSGDYGGVGVGGLATAGGIGWLVREHGLTIDHLRHVEIVLADSSVLTASDNENPDLFWAVRGAGANFGVVTSFEFEVDSIGQVGWAQLVLDATDIAAFLESWGRWIEQSPRDTTSFMIIGQPRANQATYAHVMVMIDSDDPDTIIARLQPLADVARVLNQRIAITTYADVMANAQAEDHYGQGEPTVRSGLLPRMTPEFAEASRRLIEGGGSYFFQIRSMGGAVADVPTDATAFANRSANFSVVAFGPSRTRLNAFWDQMSVHFDGLYLSFETDLRQERLLEAFPQPTLDRLRALKTIYDPTNLFRDNFNVTEMVLPVEGTAV